MIRALVASSLAGSAGIFAFVGGMGLTGSPVVALLAAAGLAGSVVFYVLKRLPLDEASCPRLLRAVSALATIAALVQLTRLAVFIVDPTHVESSFVPGSQWEVRHSCLTAYYVTAKAASTVPDIYDHKLYSAPDDDPAKPRKPLMLGPFNIDVYEYPPPFLLLPRAVRALTPEFQPMRMVWFALNGLVVLLAFVVVARWLGRAAGTRALLLSPLIWISMPTLSVLQKGNVQAMVIAATLLALGLFERRRHIAGGIIFAFMCVSKLYPGLLVVYLVARRQWRALAWTFAASVVFVIASVVDIGWAAFGTFREHFPGLLSGEAFPAFRNPPAIANNLSVPGLVFKLKLFGVPGMSFDTMRIVGTLYSIAAVIVTWFAARRAVRSDRMPLLWLAIVILATLRSPFLPQGYGAFPSIWLLTLVWAVRPDTTRGVVAMLLVWAGLNIYWPTDWVREARFAVFTNFIPQALTAVIAVVVLRRAHHRGYETDVNADATARAA
ncbi:MAG TPA: glycosyltransferase family 87 protein [Candidatus Krumholzibacteria bacterium]